MEELSRKRTWRVLEPRDWSNFEEICPKMIAHCPIAVGNFIARSDMWLDDLLRDASIAKTRGWRGRGMELKDNNADRNMSMIPRVTAFE